MLNYYYAIVFITIVMMTISIIHLFENETLSRKVNKQLKLIALLIIIGTICELLGISLNGIPFCPKYIHALVKVIEYSVAPLIPICYVKIVTDRKIEKIIKIASYILIGLNSLCELLSMFFGFVFYIDENNVYQNGDFYLIYVISYFTGIAIFVTALIRHTKRYQSKNVATLISMILFMFSGFIIRLVDSRIYIDWLVIAITYLIFIVYYSDVSLKVDSLTHLLNRKSYEFRLKKLDYTTAIFLLDVNDFKFVNDEYGHQCGDNVLKIIAKMIIKAYGKAGYCYRIGGDEFCVILKPGIIEEFSSKDANQRPTELCDQLNVKFDQFLKEQCEEYPMLKNGVAKGYALFSEFYDVESQNDEKNVYTLSSVKETVKKADERMYEDKKRSKL